MDHSSIRREFDAALEALVELVKQDRSVVAAILCGSLAHDTVWERSDVDLVLVTVDDKKVPASDMALYADGLNVHALLVPRTKFREMAEGSVHNSFTHSFLAKGRLLFTNDDTIADLHRRLLEIGSRDTSLQLLGAATAAVSTIYKARKWFITRGDLEYTALWVLYAATPLAKIEVIGRHLIADREVIPQALGLNPGFFKTVYTDLLNRAKTRENVLAALDAVDLYIAERAPGLFAPVIDYLREVGEARSCTEIEDHFTRNFDLAGVTAACEYLADCGMIGKAATAVRLTRKSNIDVQELAFFYSGKGPHGAQASDTGEAGTGRQKGDGGDSDRHQGRARS